MKNSINAKITRLYEILNELDAIRRIGLSEYLKMKYLPAALERYFHIAIEIITDLGNFLIRKLKLPHPNTYSETFEILCRNNVLPLDMEDSLVAMAKFRNRLVHGYMSIDRKYLYELLEDELETLKQVSKMLIKRINELPNKR
ncbi:MAG: type VII toxin-antitoxin system HepT family RNase toxin [Candidatus Asgardarchaeia archaeon]